MLMLKTVVSRKTPRDGRLEITPSLADRLLSLDEPLVVSVGGAEASAQVEEMPCTCNKAAATGQHVHSFLTSELLKVLAPETNVHIAVDVERGLVHIESDD